MKDFKINIHIDSKGSKTKVRVKWEVFASENGDPTEWSDQDSEIITRALQSVMNDFQMGLDKNIKNEIEDLTKTERIEK